MTPVTLDAALVLRKIRLILEDVDQIKRLAAIPLPRYLAEATNELSAERLLERAIGRMIDINYHLLIAARGLPPKSYHESFTELATLPVLDHAFARRLAVAAGIRNRLAHEYDTIDPRLVHAALQAAQTDLPEYLRQVDRYLTAQAG